MTDRVDKDSLPLNQPRRTPSHPTKSHIVKTKVDGKEKIIRFGEQGASTAGKPKAGESDRMTAKRASFKSRHAKNIAKGPSSPAYWANKVKWADGGSVRTHYAEGDSVQATPQNAALGSIANFLKKSYSPERTQQMQGTMEFLGVPGLARTVERLSYGEPITNVNKANVPMLPADTGEAAMALAEAAPVVGPLAKVARKGAIKGARVVGEELNRAILDNTGPLARMVPQAAKPLYAVKPKGGNWEPTIGSMDSVQASIRPLKRDATNRPLEDAATYGYEPEIDPKNAAMNKWLDTKLQKYIRNDMGTPDDPIRLAHEEGYSHIPGNLAEEFGAWLPDDTAAMRRKAGYPEEGFAIQRHAEAGYPTNMEANTRKAEMWENLADTEITSTAARDFQNAVQVAKDHPDLTRAQDRRNASVWGEKNPWMMKLDPETPVYKIYNPVELNTNLGFGHMTDEIQNMLNPASGLPANLRLTPEQLDKVTVKQMVERVSKVNDWRAEEAAKAEREGMMGNLTATPRMQIPDTQLSFVKEPGMTWVDIPATTDESAKKLCTTIGRQAGWCTQGDSLATSYGSGQNRLTTLIDAEGRPHAQAMITTTRVDASRLPEAYMGDEVAAETQYLNNLQSLLRERGVDDAENIIQQYVMGEEQRLPRATRRLVEELQPQAQRMLPKVELPKPDITELKPVGNYFSSARALEYEKRDPQYQPKITDSVVKFLNSGEWGKVKDLDLYDIIDAKDPSAVRKFVGENYGGDFGMVDSNTIQKDFMKNYNGERFLKAEQFSDLINDYVPRTDGYAEGGSVSTYDPMQVDEVMNSINAPRNYAEGGSVSAYDPSRVDAILNQFM
jgi:hypothetical protein